MYCPRCGHKNVEEKARHCSRCGSRLPEADSESGKEEPFAERAAASAKRLLGTTRRERLTTGAIVAALVIAAIAFMGLPTEEDDAPATGTEALFSEDDERDPYIQQADRICLEAKEKTEAASLRSAKSKARRLGPIAQYMRELAPVSDRMRADLAALDPPAEYSEQAAQLDAQLRELGPTLRQTARLAAAADLRAGPALSQVVAIGSRIESITEAMGLAACETITVTAAG